MQILKWIGLVVLMLGGAVVVMALVGASLPVQHTASRSASFKATPQQVWDVICRSTDLAAGGDSL